MKELFTKYLDLQSTENILLYVLLVFIIAWIISRLIRFIILQLIHFKKSDRFGRTSIQFLRNSVKFFVGIIALFYIIFSVPAFRSKATLIFSGAGILAAIIGFAAQAALSNLIAGAFIVIFRPFRVGDYIRLDENRVGIVVDITLRHTVINNFENKRLIIPNSVISTDSILNHSIEDSNVLSFNNFKIGVNANIDLARKIIQEEAQKLENVIYTIDTDDTLASKNDIEVRVIDVQSSYILLRAYIWLGEPFQEFKTKCQLKEAVHKRFIKEGVDLPIPIGEIIQIE